MRFSIATVLALSSVACADVRAQMLYDSAPVDFFEYVNTLQSKEPLDGPVVDGDSVTVGGIVFELRGEMKPLKLPARYSEYRIVAVGADESAHLYIDGKDQLPMLPIFFPYWGRDGKNKVASKIGPFEPVLEEGEVVGHKNPKALPGPGWFVWAHKPREGQTNKTPGELSLPPSYFEAIYNVPGQNPLKAPTLNEELLVIDGMKVKVEKPAKFMVLPEDAKDFWAAAVAGGKSGAVLVDSSRWNIGFLPFAGGKTKGNPIQALEGEPIVVNGATVGWRYAKPSPSGGWFVATGLKPSADAGELHAPEAATSPGGELSAPAPATNSSN